MILYEYATYPASPLAVPLCSQVLVPGQSPIQSAPFSQATNYISFEAPGTAYSYTPLVGSPTVVSTNGVIVYFSLGSLVTLNGPTNVTPPFIGNGIPVIGSGAVVLSVGPGSFISFIATGVTSYNTSPDGTQIVNH